MPDSQKNLSERLLSHAKLCRQMAGQTWNAEIAAELRKLAQECARAAREADREYGPNMTVH